MINRFPPTKETPKAFLSQNGFSQYLTGSTVDTDKFGALEDFSPENAVGIAIDNERNSVEEGQLYTSERMRLREHSRLVAYASFQLNGREALDQLFTENNRILVGGESRLCTVSSKTPDHLRLQTFLKLKVPVLNMYS